MVGVLDDSWFSTGPDTGIIVFEGDDDDEDGVSIMFCRGCSRFCLNIVGDATDVSSDCFTGDKDIKAKHENYFVKIKFFIF